MVRYIKMMPPYFLIMDELEGRIRDYYKTIEAGKMIEAYKWIDESAIKSSLGLSINDYCKNMDLVISSYGLISVDEVFMEVHLQEKNPLYNKNDYAIGTTLWTDYTGKLRTFKEHWVRNPIWKNKNMTPMLG